MAIQANALKTAAAADSIMTPNKRISVKDGQGSVQNVTFGNVTAAPLLAVCYPVGFNKTTGKFAPWSKPAAAKLVVDLTSAASGNWTVTAGGVTTGNIAYNATAVVVKAALAAIGYNVTVTLASSVYTITFDAETEVNVVPTVSGTVSGITGGSPTAVATAGTSTNGTHKIVGFVYPNDVQIHATNDVIGVIARKCQIAYAEIAALVASGDVTALETALKDGLFDKGIVVQGLTGVH